MDIIITDDVTNLDNDCITVDGFSEENAKEIAEILKIFLLSYENKNKETSDQDWLEYELKRELPELTDKGIGALSSDCIEEINRFDKNLSDLNITIDNGGTKEGWFVKKVEEASIGCSINEFGNYLNTVDASIQKANIQMLRVVTNTNENINQNMNLDGFIAEQHHVNSFNMNARLNGSNYVAEVLAPAPGQKYEKNSFDVVIRDNDGKIIHQYQMKYGATYKDTINLIRKGNYNNQRIVVPPEQVDQIRKVFPGKSIDSSIGGTNKVQITSQPLSKEQAKALQRQVQIEGHITKEDWNYYETKLLSINIAKNAAITGIQASAITMGFDMARRTITGEECNLNETIELALKSGSDAGIKAATTGAIYAGVEKGIITLIPKGTPVGVVANIVCVGIENTKIITKVASSELTILQALDHMGRTTTSMVYGFGWAPKGAVIGAGVLSWIPIAGPIIGGFVGGTVGYMAGSKFGNTVYNTAKKLGNQAKQFAKRTYEGVKSKGKKIMNRLFR